MNLRPQAWEAHTLSAERHPHSTTRYLRSEILSVQQAFERAVIFTLYDCQIHKEAYAQVMLV